MRFQYRALQADGRLVVGQIEADSERGALRDLSRRGVQPTAIGVATAPRARGARRRLQTGGRDRLYVMKELHALAAGGVPLAEAVGALEEAAARPALAQAYGEIGAALRRGEKFSQAIARSFPGFPAYIHRLIEAGESSGRLTEALADAAAEIENAARIRTELRNALVYPVLLVGFGALAILFIFLVVVPRFALTFRGKLDELPLLSYAIIAGGMWLRDHILVAAAAVGLAAAAAVYALRDAQTRERLFALFYRLPLAGELLVEIETARWATVLARLLENRVPLMSSLELARGALRNRDIQLRLTQVERRVRAGGALAAALDETRFLPPTALRLVTVGERSGSLAEMLRNVAGIYDDIVKNRIKAVLSIIEPVAIILIGGIIGTVAVAIFMAITTINKLPGL